MRRFFLFFLFGTAGTTGVSAAMTVQPTMLFGAALGGGSTVHRVNADLLDGGFFTGRFAQRLFRAAFAGV